MALSFPTSPTNGDTHNQFGVTYIYNSTSNLWKAKGVANDSDLFVGFYNQAVSAGGISTATTISTSNTGRGEIDGVRLITYRVEGGADPTVADFSGAIFLGEY